MLIVIVVAVLVAVSGCAPPVQEELTDPNGAELEATISAPAKLSNSRPVILRFRLTNHSSTRLFVLDWYTPLEGIAGEIFAVTRDGEEVPYRGILASRAAPLAADYVLLRPGESARAEVDLSTVYDFSQAGDYTIRFLSPRISHVARSEDEMARSVDDLGPVEIVSKPIILQRDDQGNLSGRLTVAEARERLLAHLLSQKPALSPDVDLDLKEIDMLELWESLRVQLFRVVGGPFLGETFLIGEQTILVLGTAVGDVGVTSMVVRDLNHDGRAELLFTYSFGSGIHQSRMAMYAPRYAADRIYEGRTLFLGDMGLTEKDSSTVEVRAFRPVPATSSREWSHLLGYPEIRQDEEDIALVLRVADGLSMEQRRKLIEVTWTGEEDEIAR